jgi:hypothetical protein
MSGSFLNGRVFKISLLEKFMKKELVIFVPGANYLRPGKNWFEDLILGVYRIIGIENPIKKSYSPIWIKALKKNNRDVFWLHWSGGLTLLSKWLAVRRLKKLINHYKNTHNISLVGISLGGEIVLETLPEFEKIVKSAILLCSTNEKTKIKSNIKIFNIYSPDDFFEQIATKFLAPLNGGISLSGKHVKNISLPGMRHENFCFNDLIPSYPYKGKRLSYLVNKFLD